MLKPQKIFEQDGDSFTVKTLTTFRNYSTSFKIGEEFEEITKGLDNRKCQVRTHTHTHTSDLLSWWGLTKGIIILNKFYILPHYTNPTPEPITEI